MNILAANPPVSTGPAAARALVRVVIVGHVDHGKSTLIGRLLHETDSLPAGRLDFLKAVSARRGMPFEWSFLLDALQTERDQGITIDTSQIRFRTPSRDVVLIDAPGHAEFLRNMITGASQADAALLIVDAVEGIRDQTRRHGYLLHLLGIRQVVVVVNKMDRIGYDAARFNEIQSELSVQLKALGIVPAEFIPISAREGEGVARFTAATGWYQGPTVIHAIDRFDPRRPADELPLRFPVQAVYKFDDRRIIAGRVETGRLSVGDEIVVSPSGKSARILSIETWPAPARNRTPSEAAAGQSVGVTLDREILVERGEILSSTAFRPKTSRRIRARVFWLHEQPIRRGDRISLRLGTAEVRATVVSIDKTIDPGELSPTIADTIGTNQVGEMEIALARQIAADPQAVNPLTGRIVFEFAGRIAGGGLVLSLPASDEGSASTNIVPVRSSVSDNELVRRFGYLGSVVWFTGLPGSGKSTLARALERRLFDRGAATVLLDGDTLRAGLNADLGFSPADRAENVRRTAEVAAHIARSGLIAIVAVVSPSAESRAAARRIVGKNFFEIHVATPLEVCESRDPKGHYRKARAGEIPGFTGVSATYEPPANSELRIDTTSYSIDAAAQEIEKLLPTDEGIV